MNESRSGVVGRTGRAALVLAAMALTLPAGAWADNNDFESALPLGYGIVGTAINTVATIQTGESMTLAGASGRDACVFNPPANTDFTRTDHTMWWALLGSGREVTITTSGTNFDSTLGIFRFAPTELAQECADSDPNESLSIPTTAGAVYYLQVGGCEMSSTHAGGCGSPTTGTIHVTATSTAASNDNKGSAAALATGQQTQGDNYAASEEGGEAVVCSSHGGQSPYGRTVWYRWHAPSDGHVVFGATSAFDNVLAVYRDGGPTPVACDDDPNRSGPSRIEMNVTAGDYLLQVAGYGAHNAAASIDSAQGSFTVSAEFAATPPNPDRDGDGVKNEVDCQPDNPAVHQGARDKPGNGIDENCDRRDARFPVLKVDPPKVVSQGVGRGRIRLLRVSVVVPRGSKVQLRCSRRGCRTSTRKVAGRSGRRTYVVHGLAGKIIRRNRFFSLYVTKTGYRGVYLRYRNVRGELTKSQRCLASGSRKFTTCS
jgi:hypothetical protein